jgi:hypothetical protein
MGRTPVSPSGLESAYLECVADPSISRPNGAMHSSEGCNPGKGQERVNVSGVVPNVPPWAGMRRPVGRARQVKGVVARYC